MLKVGDALKPPLLYYWRRDTKELVQKKDGRD
jgi:hypothetical protein